MKPVFKRCLGMGWMLLPLLGVAAGGTTEEKNASDLRIERVLAKNVHLYAQPGGGTPVRSVAKADMKVPLAVQACGTAFCQIELNGETLWVDQMQVQISRTSAANCMVTATTSAPVGALPGAGGNTCAPSAR